MSEAQENRRGGKTPPKSEEAERAILGALLLDPDRFPDVADLLEAEDFSDRRHVAIYEAISVLADRGAPIDFVSVGEVLKAKDAFESSGGADKRTAIESFHESRKPDRAVRGKRFESTS